jgi:wyosine [tRNA(Phe)-imidazoG37] synthetase (radical SAM superfamily)
MLLELKKAAVYGPVRSRRLGRSLGINLFPGRRKLCTLDCLYCQYGWTKPGGPARLDVQRLLAPEEILAAVGEALEAMDEPPAWLTFSGNGEPTLHPRFPEIVEGLLPLRDRLAPAAGTAILSNSSEAGRPEVRAALARLDLRVMKLDVGTEAAFRRFNRPAPGITLAGILEGLRKIENLTLQSLFAAGEGGNLDPRHVEAWVDTAASRSPLRVQIYTLARESPARALAPAPAGELERLRDRLLARGVAAEVF